MIHFVHTADVHFGMENYGKVDPHTGIHSRLLDFYKAFNECIDYAVNENVDFFLFAGDAYKTAHPSQTQQKLLMQSLLRLYKAGIPVVIVIGNHDHPLSFGKANALDIFGTLPLDGFHVMSKPDVIKLQTKNGPVAIVGIPWPTRNTISVAQQHLDKNANEITDYIAKAVAHIIKSHAEKLDPAVPAILTGHLTVSNGIFSGSEKRAIYGTDPLLMVSDLAIEPFDYVALGHLHRYQNLNPGGYPAIVYSGSIERIDFGERKEEKGFCAVQIQEKGKCEHQFIPVKTRRFVQIDVSLQSDEKQTEQILDSLEKYTIDDAVIKIIYYVPENIIDMVDHRMIQAACQKAWYVVGIIPCKKASTRERRLGVGQRDMSIEALLGLYFDTKPELKERKDDLISKAIILMHEDKDQEVL